MKVVELYPTNFRDVVATLRTIADEVERGDFGEVKCCAIAMRGTRLNIFSCGPDADVSSAAIVLMAGANRLAELYTRDEA